MFKKTAFFLGFLVIGFLALLPSLVWADGGMVVWPPDIHLDQSAQNAIVAWNGQKEVIILSNDIQGENPGTVLRMVPLPSDPTEIKEGDFESFENLTQIINSKREKIREEWMRAGKEAGAAPSTGIEITFQKKIGAHDITVVKVNDLDDFLDWIEEFAQEKGFGDKEISPEFKKGVKNYLKRDIRYFVFDVIDASSKKESINPLIYEFDSDLLYYPLKITGVSEVGSSYAKVSIFLICEEFTGEGFESQFPVELTSPELEEINEDIASLFDSKAEVLKFDYQDRFNNLEKDFVLFPSRFWENNLSLGSSGSRVKVLQKMLINQGFWNSEVEATGYFGPITKKALARFQKEHQYQILKPLNLEEGTGFFGPKTREFLEEATVKGPRAPVWRWSQNLSLGMRGEKVKALQQILIDRGVWGEPEVGPTGYFGPITKSALKKFQEKHAPEILEPLGLKKGTGFLGPSTRSFLEDLLEK